LATGPNRLPIAPPASALAVLTAQLRSVIVLLLAAAIAISLLFDDRIEAAAIAAVLVINTLIGFMTEFRARRAMDALVRLDVPRAFAWRDGRLQVIDARASCPATSSKSRPAARCPRMRDSCTRATCAQTRRRSPASPCR
jgi:Ca2+-transporting ATPase